MTVASPQPAELVPVGRPRDSTSGITSGSEPFCRWCDRIRITAEGQLRTCLFAHTETDLRSVARSGEDDEALAHAIRRAVWHKELKHYIGDKRFRRTARSMSMIGG